MTYANPPPNVTLLLSAVERGEMLATEQLLPLVYEELRKLAGAAMAGEAPGNTLQPTALVHEAYLRLVGQKDPPGWQNRGHFYAAAAEAMRRILIESARRRASLKRGGDHARLNLDDAPAPASDFSADDLLAIDDALRKLEPIDSESYRVVMLRYFGGLTMEEVAAALGVSLRTAQRNWSFARAWLQRELRRGEERGG